MRIRRSFVALCALCVCVALVHPVCGELLTETQDESLAQHKQKGKKSGAKSGKKTKEQQQAEDKAAIEARIGVRVELVMAALRGAGNGGDIVENLRKLAAVKGWVTPCSMYNSFHTQGDATCKECTQINFSIRDVVTRKSAYFMHKGRNGDSYPVGRFLLPKIKEGKYTDHCLWCPEKQRCGHPLDYNMECGREPDIGSPIAGYVHQPDCVDSMVKNDEGVMNENQRQREIENQLGDDAERAVHALDEKKIALYPANVHDRETQNLDYIDTRDECYGDCVTSGVSSCSRGTTRILTYQSAQRPLNQKKPPLKKAFTPPTSTTPVPCSMELQPDAVSPQRVFGVFSLTDPTWIVCRLVDCLLPPGPDYT